MNKKKIIYIIFENANRELFGKLLLCAYALNKDYHVVIGEKNELRSIIKYLPPGIIIEKALRKGSNKRFNHWEKMNTILDNKITLDRETHRYSLLDNPDIIFTSVTTYLDYFHSLT